MSLIVNLSHKAPAFPARVSKIGADNVFTINKAKVIKSPHPAVSENAMGNTLLGLTIGDEASALGQISPEQQSLKTLKNGIYELIESLKEKVKVMNDDITGIIVGGKNSRDASSFDIFNEIANILEEFGIPFSMICGKFDNIASDNLIIGKGKATLWNKSLQNIDFPKNASQKEIEDVLSKNYEVVDLTNEVPISIAD